MNRSALLRVALASLLVLGVAACKTNKAAPSASATAAGGPAPLPKVSPKKYIVDTNESLVTFTMSAPLERIRGRAAAATSGELSFDPIDVTQTTGSFAVDLDKLEVFRSAKGEKGFEEEEKSLQQNEHARAWLGLGDGVDEAQRKKNARAEYKITSILSSSLRDVTRLTGALRTVQIKAEGTLTLHGKTTEKVATQLEVTFKFEGDKITGVTLKTKIPIPIALVEYGIQPADVPAWVQEMGFAQLSDRLAKDAPVELSIVLKPEGGAFSATPPPADPTPVSSERVGAASASASASAAPSAGPPRP